MKNIFYKFLSFYKRRIIIPGVERNHLVLDLGSGDKPHWRADVLLDLYIEKKYGNQRSGDSEVTITKPLVIASVENMPFKDGVFDYVICSHLLEHVKNPGRAIDEITRVGKAGYIELPYEGSAKISDFPTHLWYCKKENNKLIFTAKKKELFDLEVDKLFRNKNFEKEFRKIGSNFFDLFSVSFYWKNKVNYKINGKPNMKILDQAKTEEVIYKPLIFKMRKIFVNFISIIFFYKKNNTKLNLEKLLICTKCKNNIKKKDGMYTCEKCKNKIIVVERK